MIYRKTAQSKARMMAISGLITVVATTVAPMTAYAKECPCFKFVKLESCDNSSAIIANWLAESERIEAAGDSLCIIQAQGPGDQNGEDIIILQGTTGPYYPGLNHTSEETEEIFKYMRAPGGSQLTCMTSKDAPDRNCDGINDEKQSSKLLNQRVAATISRDGKIIVEPKAINEEIEPTLKRQMQSR